MNTFTTSKYHRRPLRAIFVISLFAVVVLCLSSIPAVAGASSIPNQEQIQTTIHEAYAKYKGVSDGKNADYIPFLAKIDPNLYGIAVVTIDGKVYEIGDTRFKLGIESISKVVVLALAMQDNGPETIVKKIGVNATGLPFNSVLAIELEKGRTVNPFVNAGAIATNSLVKAKTSDEKWKRIMDYFNRFAGRELKVIDELYKSESATNQHNQAIAKLLESYGRIYDDPAVSVELYTRQCSLGIDTRDLAVMAATLANYGVNPLTKDWLVDPDYVPEILAIMSTTGLYDNTGEWLFYVGLPAKSGVGGGIMAVVPGVMGIAAFSPPLDTAGNSVRAQKAIRYISEKLDLNLFSPGEGT